MKLRSKTLKPLWQKSFHFLWGGVYPNVRHCLPVAAKAFSFCLLSLDYRIDLVVRFVACVGQSFVSPKPRLRFCVVFVPFRAFLFHCCSIIDI